MLVRATMLARSLPVAFVGLLVAAAAAASPRTVPANPATHSFSVAGPQRPLLPGARTHGRDTILHDFGAGTDGSAPRSELIMDSSGALYGTTTSQGGGCSTCGMVFSLKPSGGTYVESNLYGFLGPPHDGYQPFAGLVADSKGNLYGTTHAGGHGTCSNGCGTVFKLTSFGDGHYIESLLYEFKGGHDGSDPYGGLIFDASGDLFGTTLNGGKGCGTSGCGTVYELKPNGSAYTEQVLYRFPPETGSLGGGHPYGSLVLDKSGNLYGTTSNGGTAACACGTVYQLKPAQPYYKEKILYSFVSSPDGSTPVAGLVADKNGTLYGTTQYGGSGSCECGTVFEIVRIKGHYFENVIYSFSGPDGALPMGPVIVDQKGVLYGTTNTGGRSGKGAVFALTPSGSTYTEQVVHSFTDGSNNDGADPWGGVLLANGLLYGTTYVGGTLELGIAYSVPTPTPAPLQAPAPMLRPRQAQTQAAVSPRISRGFGLAASNSQPRDVSQVPQVRNTTLAEDLLIGRVRRNCGHNVPPGQIACTPMLILNDVWLAPRSTCDKKISAGYAPCDLYEAYNLKKSIHNLGATVAIVNWYRDPNIVADAAVYRAAGGLPKCNRKTGNGCVTELNEKGESSPLPEDDPYGSAAPEWSLDVDMVSAMCPACKIVLLEASTSNDSDLAIAENSAAKVPGVVAIANSWAAYCLCEETKSSFVQAFDHPGIAITANAGDASYDVHSPADYATVTSVGGTTLTRVRKGGTRPGWKETVWSGTGGGCSEKFAAPPWQTAIEAMDQLTGCSMRVVSDVAFVGDPKTGVAYYCSYSKCPQSSPWRVAGGSSIGAPAVAGLYALAGNTSIYPVPAKLAYNNPWPNNFNDITSGSNGSCGAFWLCNAQAGYDAPSGVGSPNGIGGF
jgi:uncharacterized repeat protein (TIGR03803 family)